MADGFVPRNRLGNYILNNKSNIKLTGLKSRMVGGVYGYVIKDTLIRRPLHLASV